MSICHVQTALWSGVDKNCEIPHMYKSINSKRKAHPGNGNLSVISCAFGQYPLLIMTFPRLKGYINVTKFEEVHSQINNYGYQCLYEDIKIILRRRSLGTSKIKCSIPYIYIYISKLIKLKRKKFLDFYIFHVIKKPELILGRLLNMNMSYMKSCGVTYFVVNL